MILPENPCTCGEPLCDKTHYVQCAVGIHPSQPMDVQTAQEALDAMRQASVSILAACDDDAAEHWFDDIRRDIAERRQTRAN